MDVTGVTTYRKGDYVYVELEINDGERLISLPRQAIFSEFWEHTTENGLRILPDADTYNAQFDPTSSAQPIAETSSNVEGVNNKE